MKNNPFFSIVIPTLNEEKYLPLLLEDLSNQSNNSFEVIHVDAKSEDKTIEEVSKFKSKIDITTFTTEKRNVSHQRNIGISKSRGNWIIFMDADNRLKPAFLDGIKYRLAQKSETDLFTTWVTVDKGMSINQPIQRSINLGLELFKLIGKEWSLGALIGVKTKIAKKFRYDVNQKVGEDGIFVKTLIDSGYNFNIIKDPRYKYSLRRLETDGSINYIRSTAKIALNYLQGKDFKNENFGYSMDGGSYYETKYYFSYKKFPQYIKSLPKKQFDQVKKLYNYLTDIGL